jgi:hypothetical protein
VTAASVVESRTYDAAAVAAPAPTNPIDVIDSGWGWRH